MSEAVRKRILAFNTSVQDINSATMICKENIPPDVHNNKSPTKRKISVQDTSMEATTPKKARQLLDEPATPSSNFKLLTSLAATLEYANCSDSVLNETPEDQMSCNFDISDLSACKVNRKEKSLAIICTRFLSMYPLYPKSDEKITISLDEASVQLCVERRRLYDIVNVFESIDILTKIGKNQYLWFGKNFLLQSLSKLKEAAEKENILEKLQYVRQLECDPNCKQSCILSEVQNFKRTFEFPNSTNILSPAPSPEARREKSLGIMSQKFLMLFLVSPNKIISLGLAAKVLNGFIHRNERGAQIKTQIRRLYDIANVLSSIGLIKKQTALSICGRKPAFKYIGPDLKDFKGNFICGEGSKSVPALKSKKPGFARHSSFQEICAVAEIEHQKLNLGENHNSAPPFDFAMTDQKENAKTNFEDLKLNDCAKPKSNSDEIKIKPKVKTQYLVKPNLRLINLSGSSNPTGPYCIINNTAVEKKDDKQSNISYGTQTYLLINTVTSSKEVKTETVENKPVNKASSPQTIALSSQQRDAILQSLNISLSSEQMAAIQLDGASESNNSVASLNVLKIINKNKTIDVSGGATNIVRLSAPKEAEQITASTRSNTPSSIQASDSPLSIPSGYVTPIPNVSSEISFVSNVEVNDILKRIENQSNFEGINKLKNSNERNIKLCSLTPTNPDTKLMDNPNSTLDNISAKTHLINQQPQMISNDSCSSESLNLEVSNILNNREANYVKRSKPFLIDEKTLLSPIKTPASPLPLNLITPPYMAPDTIFVFSNHPVNYKTALNDISNFSSIVPKLNSVNKK